MKRFISALAFCSSLLVLLSIFLFPPVTAKEDPITILLTLPAPPPPNPLVIGAYRERDQKFYDKNNPPKDNASIDDLMAYWQQIASSQQDLRYNPEPSDRALDRIKAEIEKDPKKLIGSLNLFKKDPRGGDWVKGIFDAQGTTGAFDKDERSTIRKWLLYNSSYYSSDLARLAGNAGDTDQYVSNQDELLALTRVDFDKARPLIDRLYNDSTLKTSKVLARWALYRHALDSDSIGDVDRYRDELKAIVEDKSAIPGMRDLAMDALVAEKEWPGRDEWYYSLLGDETLADLRVNGTTYTGLTTLMLVSPDNKYIEKMLELVRSSNPTVRGAAIRNLITKIEGGGPDVIKALLPWLEDPKWAVNVADSRGAIVRKLSEYEIPESVPGLINVLDEKQRRSVPNYGANAVKGSANAMDAAARAAQSAANAVANAANAAASVTRSNANRAVKDYFANLPDAVEKDFYPLRSSAVTALAKQKDPRAVPALRRILPEGESYERSAIVKALLDCGGFSVGEQMDALETVAKGVRDQLDAGADAANVSITGYAYSNVNAYAGPRRLEISGPEIKQLLAQQLLNASEISDELARSIVSRIEGLDKTDKQLAAAYRRMILKWQNAAINLLLLSDVKRGIADTDTIVRLLSQRKDLREKQPMDVSDLRNGNGSAIGIAACLFEDANDQAAILEGGSTETKTAMLACARMIRAPLPVAKVAENLNTESAALAIAAERYLESEDSPEARTLVLSRHPGEAKILGAMGSFEVEGVETAYSEYLWALYRSIGNDSLYNGWGGSSNDAELLAVEKGLRAEVKKDEDLFGIYAYDSNYIRIYKDRVVFSWDEDDSRYRERRMSKYEFDYIKAYLTDNKADELPPFLACGGDYCEAKELVMVGRNGGRRVYTNGESDFFKGLDKYFADLKQTPGALRYGLSREIPGLEIILASDDLHAETVWKNGDDLRVCASEPAVRKKVKAEIAKLGASENGEEETVEEPESYGQQTPEQATQLVKRRYEGYAWYRITENDSAPATQPPGVEIIPLRDALAVQPDEETWKARAAGIEVRASGDGLFKLVRGRLTKLHPGGYSYPVITPNGRWVFASRSGDEGGDDVVRVDLLTNREYPIEIEGYGQKRAVAFVPTLGKVLVVRSERYYDGHSEYAPAEDDDTTPEDDDPGGMSLVDPATGMVIPLTEGELRPVSQQTFRPLQKAAQPDEYWAAMPNSEKNETLVGIYNAKWLTFKAVRQIPKIKFNSMDMWVDEASGKIYFVYRGHLLSLPLRQ